MKKLFLSSALSITSVFITPAVFAGPGESLGNTKNDCNTSSGDCPITPTKFSAKIYQVALCTSHPMPAGSALDLAGSGCVDVYKSDAGEEFKQATFMVIDGSTNKKDLSDQLKIISSMSLSLFIKNFEDPDRFRLLNDIESKSKTCLTKSKLNSLSSRFTSFA